MPRDPLEVFGGVLENIWIRLVAFAASTIVGWMLGPVVAETGLLDFLGSIAFYGALATALAMLIIVVRAEASKIVCLALVVNCVTWCVLTAIVATALGQA